MRKKTEPKKPVADIVAEQIIAALETENAPWVKPWSTIGMPRSISTGRDYTGINVFMLSIHGMDYSRNAWGTYEQIAKQGGQVRKGEKSCLVTFYSTFDKKVEGQDEPQKRFVLRYFRVFNIEQADWPDGVPAKWDNKLFDTAETNPLALTFVNNFCAGNGPTVNRGGDRATYNPATDTITVPPTERFTTENGLWATMMHEIGHSTGAANRLNREGVTNPVKFGTERYGFEELVAEFTGAMLCATFGIDDTREQSAAYCRSWAEAIRNDKSMVMKAASAAKKAWVYALAAAGMTPAVASDETALAA